MKIKLLKTWSGFPPGHEFSSMHVGMQLTLVERRFAEVVEADTTVRHRRKKKKLKPEEPTEDPTDEEQADARPTSENQPSDKHGHATGKPGGRKKAARNSS